MKRERCTARSAGFNNYAGIKQELLALGGFVFWCGVFLSFATSFLFGQYNMCVPYVMKTQLLLLFGQVAVARSHSLSHSLRRAFAVRKTHAPCPSASSPSSTASSSRGSSRPPRASAASCCQSRRCPRCAIVQAARRAPLFPATIIPPQYQCTHDDKPPGRGGANTPRRHI